MLAAVAATACRGDAPCGPRADHTVVACVDGTPVTASEVAEHLRLQTPERALDDAVRVRLFAAEATRRGLSAGSATGARRTSALYQALVQDEAAREGATVERISEEEARQYYAAHPGEFNKITRTIARAVFADDEAGARELHRKLTAGDDAPLAEAVELGEVHEPGVDPALTRAANDLRAPYTLAEPVQTADGRWAVVQATSVEMETAPFDALMTRTVQNALAHRRERAALDALDARLRAQHDVRLFADELGFVPRP